MILSSRSRQAQGGKQYELRKRVQCPAGGIGVIRLELKAGCRLKWIIRKAVAFYKPFNLEKMDSAGVTPCRTKSAISYRLADVEQRDQLGWRRAEICLKSNKGSQPKEKRVTPPAIPTDLSLIRQLSSLVSDESLRTSDVASLLLASPR